MQIEALVSIIIPLHNRAGMVRDALASVRAQTYQNVETIVVDDGSSDGSLRVAETFLPTVRGIRLQTALGPSAARNAGVMAARGRYVLFLDDDDLLHPRHVEELVARAESPAEGKAVCGRWRRFVNRAGSCELGPVVGGEAVPQGDWIMEITNPTGEGRTALMACLWPLEVVREIRWDEELFTNGDVDFYMRWVLGGFRIAPVNAGMAYYRCHSGPQVAGTFSERGLRSSTAYRLSLCERLNGHAERDRYAPGIRQSLMSLALAWAGISGNGDLVRKLCALYRQWGGRRYEMPVSPRNPVKRAVAAAVLRLGGPRVLGRLMSMRAEPTGSREGLPIPQERPDARDGEDREVLGQLLAEAKRSAAGQGCLAGPSRGEEDW